jgi:hypothetical protein
MSDAGYEDVQSFMNVRKPNSLALVIEYHCRVNDF